MTHSSPASNAGAWFRWALVLSLLIAVPRWAAAQTPQPQAQAQPQPQGAPPPYPPSQYPPPPGTPYPPPPGYAPYPPPPYPYPPAAYARPVDPPATATHVGLGYKIGNGLGFVGGDVIVSPLPHLVLDLQANTFSASTTSGTAHGFGLAPAAQVYLRDPGVSTPYLGVGYVYASLKLADVKASLNGVFINAGYEWKWSFGLGILLGGGVTYVGTIEATDGVTTISRKGGVYPNIEASLRFMFL